MLREELQKEFAALRALSIEELLERRYARFRRIGAPGEEDVIRP